MSDSVDRRIAKRHANAPKEAFDELLTVQEWQEHLERVPSMVFLEIGGVPWHRSTDDLWAGGRKRLPTAQLALWAHAKSMEALGVQTDGIVVPEAGSGCEAGDSA